MYAVRQTERFADWHGGLADEKARDADSVRIVRPEAGNFADSKSVGGKVTEMRIDLGPGYRIYYTRRGLEVVILLCGGNKSTQKADIKAAQAMAKALGERDGKPAKKAKK